jgi:hypothetical protein
VHRWRDLGRGRLRAMAEQRTTRISTIAVIISAVVLIAVVGLAFLKAPASPQSAAVGAAGDALPVMYEFTSDT